uniref:Uncharacterized protein n=1 Tax=Arundo donax TaxID=35708 RepID=A0A0A8Z7E1_ARUDO
MLCMARSTRSCVLLYCKLAVTSRASLQLQAKYRERSPLMKYVGSDLSLLLCPFYKKAKLPGLRSCRR